MSATRNNDIFIYYDDDEKYDYYYKIEDLEYFRPKPSFKNFGNFRVHGKYVSNFHPGKIPNEYYCQASEAMTLRSGRKLNYMREGVFWKEANKMIRSFDCTPDGRCLSVKEMIWFWESYYHLLSNSYDLPKLYDTARDKIKQFIKTLETSAPGVYHKVKFEKKTDSQGHYYEVDHSIPMPRRDTDGKYVFCNCCYTVIKDGKTAIIQEGHHVDEFLPKLRKLMRMYSKPHRIVKDSLAFKAITRRINEDCRQMVFDFISTEDIKF